MGHQTKVAIKLFAVYLLSLLVISTNSVGTTNHHKPHHNNHHYQHYQRHHFHNTDTPTDDNYRQPDSSNDELSKDTTFHISSTQSIVSTTTTAKSLPDSNYHHEIEKSTLTTSISEPKFTADTGKDIRPTINQRLCPRRCSKRARSKVLRLLDTNYIVPSKDYPSNGKLTSQRTDSSICGSDKQFYPTHCHMHQVSCLTGQIIRPVHPSLCRSSESSDDASVMNNKSNSDHDELVLNQKIPHHNNQLWKKKQESHDSTNTQEDYLNEADQNDIISDTEIDQDDLNEDQDDSSDDTIKSFETLLLHNRSRLETNSTNSVIDNKLICNRQMYHQMLMMIATLAERNSNEIFRYFDRNHDLNIGLHELLLESANDSSVLFANIKSKELPINVGGNFILEPLFDDNPCSLSHILIYEDKNRDDVIDLNEMTTAFKQVSRNDVPGEQIYISSDPTIRSKIVVSYKRHYVNLGDSLKIACEMNGYNINSDSASSIKTGGKNIEWLRNGVQLLNMQPQSMNRQLKIDQEDSSLQLRDIQLFMSGNYTCRGPLNDKYSKQIYEQNHYLHVYVPAKVSVRPAFQWAPIGSQAQLECQYEHLSSFTSDGGTLKVRWFKNGQELRDKSQAESAVILKNYTNLPTSSPDDGFYEYDSQSSNGASSQEARGIDVDEMPHIHGQENTPSVSMSMSSSKLTINSLTPSDTGSISCRASLEYKEPERLAGTFNNNSSSSSDRLLSVVASDYGSLLVQDDPARIVTDDLDSSREHLWLFHDNGITIYSISMNGADDQMQLIRDFTGHNTIAPQIDNNWNQLTLCGGLNPDEAVICEWSDNAVIVRQQYLTPYSGINLQRRHRNKKSLGYVYVGQPNLNRVLVFDSQQFEIVSIVKTDPQPKQLWLYNTHILSKHHHQSRLRSPMDNYRNLNNNQHDDFKRETSAQYRSDIWILCHGQPLVVDTTNGNTNNINQLDGRAVSTDFIQFNDQMILPIKYDVDDQLSKVDKQNIDYYWQQQMLSKEQRLRNRKSVQIIRTTSRHDTAMSENQSRLHRDDGHHQQVNNSSNNHLDVSNFSESAEATTVAAASISNSLKRFRLSTSIASYHLKSDHPFGLIHDLYMPHIATPLIDNYRYHVQYAYVSHYDERKLVRINMDKMVSDTTFDLGDCVPVYQLTTATGLLIIQCRTPITHQLKGQLILDQLTNSFIGYNMDIQAQRSFLSPDHRYLVSIYTEYKSSKSQDQSTPQMTGKRFASTKIIVQKVKRDRLEFQYDVNTSLFIIDCAFVWKNGDYNAILVSDLGQQDEILSLRLLDGRVELISGILGRISNQHSSLRVSDRSKLAAIATNKGVYVLDMEDNRVKCQVPKHHQFTSATLLWA